NVNDFLKSGQLKLVFLISPDYFGGSEGADNQIVITPDAEKEKQRIDEELYNYLKQEKSVENFHVDLDYEESSASIVPKRIIVSATIDGEDYRRVIEVW
ncbi:hypothetical protein J6S37_02385, partial [Candidatus Saccharibacteria bacterium]|nr:hypothetical protein [Candidatus Saccharibacteria bacterium]